MPRTSEHAFSYVEVCLAMAILSICLLPGMRMLPALLEGQRGVEMKYELSLIAEENLETAALALDADFAASSEAGDLADRGHADWRYSTVVEIPAEGGGRYATVRADAWADLDGDGQFPPEDGEPHVRLDTVVANCDWTP